MKVQDKLADLQIHSYQQPKHPSDHVAHRTSELMQVSTSFDQWTTISDDARLLVQRNEAVRDDLRLLQNHVKGGRVGALWSMLRRQKITLRMHVPRGDRRLLHTSLFAIRIRRDRESDTGSMPFTNGFGNSVCLQRTQLFRRTRYGHS
jgi:hypothetical protein